MMLTDRDLPTLRHAPPHMRTAHLAERLEEMAERVGKQCLTAELVRIAYTLEAMMPKPKPTHLVLISAPLGSPKAPAPVTVYAAGLVRILCARCMEPMGREHGNACTTTTEGVD